MHTRLESLTRAPRLRQAVALGLLMVSACGFVSDGQSRGGGLDASGDAALQVSVARSMGGSDSSAAAASSSLMALNDARPVTPPVDDPLLAPVTGEASDHSLSPYFFIPSEDPSIDQLPLKSTSADVDIAGVIADVTVTQVYKNEGQHPLEAVYVFPGSTRAAVYAMKMTIGERTLEAKIEKRDQARQQYEQAKLEGKSASLLEQQRPNVFQMNVANIMPGDQIEVELRYTELLIPTAGIYEFVYPTVVGPRYSSQPEASAPERDRFVANPYLKGGEAPTYGFDLTATLSTGLPLQGIGCPSHKVNVQYDGPSFATVSLDRGDTAGGNRDFVLRYRLAGDQVQSGLMLYQGKDESFFLMMAQPPRRVEEAQITPREYIFIVDISGSMNGFPLETAQKLLRDLIGHLRPTDTFNVVLFAGSTAVLAEQSQPASEGNIQRALEVIDRQRGGGGTELMGALQRAMALPKTPGYARSIVVVTDGYVSVEAQAFDYIRAHLGEANLFAFGIGRSVNRHLIEGMARAGQGEPQMILDPKDAPAKAAAFRRYIEAPVLTGVQLAFDGFDAYDVAPAAIPDVLAERPVIVFGKYRGSPTGQVKLTGHTAEGAYAETFQVRTVKPLEQNRALRYLWARDRIATLADARMLRGADPRIEEVTGLGLRYNLLTEYTSFVAVDSQVRNAGQPATTVQQPLPLPEGVSNLAVGSGYGVGGSAASGIGSIGRGVVSPGAVMARKGAMAETAAGRGAPPPAAARPAAPQPAAVQSTTTLEASSVGKSIEADERAAGTRDRADQPAARESEKKARQKDDSAAVTPRVVLEGAVRVSGPVSAQSASAVIQAHLAELTACYLEALGVNAALAGRLTVTLRLDARGVVTAVELTGIDASLRSGQLETCLTAKLRQWQVPVTSSTTGGTLAFTLAFSTR